MELGFNLGLKPRLEGARHCLCENFDVLVWDGRKMRKDRKMSYSCYSVEEVMLYVTSALRMNCAISDLHARYQRKRCLRRYALKGTASKLKQRLARSQRPAKGTPVMSPNVLGGIP